MTIKTSHPSTWEVVHYSLYLIPKMHESTMNNLSSYKELIAYILKATLKAPKSYTMQVIWVECSNQCQCIKRITKGQ